MRRRDFITLLSGAAVAWPHVAGAQQPDRMRRVGVLMVGDEADPERKGWLSQFVQTLADSGWKEGGNLRLDVRWAGSTAERIPALSNELVALQPDAILASGTPATATLKHATATVPIVFLLVADPINDGFVASLAHPSGNLTGFGDYENTIVGKWLELLTQVAPNIKRVAMIFNPDTAPYAKAYYLPLFETAAQSLKVEPLPMPVHNEAEIEAIMAALAREPKGGLVAPGDTFLNSRSALIASLAERMKIPVVSNAVNMVRQGGLLSYGDDYRDTYRQAALYVDRILRGARPADLPVQLPTKFQFSINLKTAKALGLTVSSEMQLLADEVIE
jgi:putative tryptophan/tyrosine transport system substrate-binding protein